jgi:hypothetical protein
MTDVEQYKWIYTLFSLSVLQGFSFPTFKGAIKGNPASRGQFFSLPS